MTKQKLFSDGLFVFVLICKSRAGIMPDVV
nr:MAG TPA: hypothetical protein [Inoviridae sp.]